MRLNMPARHLVVALAVIVLGGLTGFGCVGPAVGPERIHSFDVTAIVREDRTVSIREVVDYDFGGESRHGIFRTIPASGGAPEEIEVSSPTAPDELSVQDLGSETEIRIGDPDEEVRGRHRYVISYVLPATVVADTFALNVIGDQWPVDIEHVEARILGADLDGPRCFTGPYGSTERCQITETGEGYAVTLDHLDDHAGITVDGTLTATRPAELPPLPPFEERDGGARLAWAGIVVGLGAIAALVVFVVSRQIGRNEVAGGGATDAAFVPFGEETFGVPHEAPAGPPPPVPGARMVADADMAELAGIDFVPPGGIEPWQASVVSRETIDDRTVGAWFASQTAHDILVIDNDGGDVTLRPGPKAATADATVAPILNRALAGQQEVQLGTYNPTFAAAWREAATAIDGWSVGSQTFRRRPPRHGAAGCGAVAGLGALVPLGIVFATFVAAGGPAAGFRTTFAAIALAILVPAGVAFLAYRRLTRSLSARGSAIALRTESFRRFLHDSEAQHVEWAWQNGLLREYSAWAVALGEVDAWNSAMAASSVPPAEVHATTGVMAPAIYASSFSSTTTAPSSSGSSSGGGFSGGGFSGGGGGGGGGGSW